MILRKTRLTFASLMLLAALSGCDSQEDKFQKYIERGNQLFAQGDTKRARLEYKNAARIEPANAEVRYRMGLLDEADGNIRAAFASFTAAEQQNARHQQALLKLVQFYIAGESYDEAQKRLDIVLQDDPKNADGHALRAALYLRHNEFDQTETEARAALGFDAGNIMAYTVLTGLYVAQTAFDKASATVEEALVRNPKKVALLILKAMVYEKAGNMEKVVEAHQALFSLNPAEVKFRDNLAKIYIQAEKKDEAEKVMRDGVSAAPDSWDMKRRLIAFLNEFRGLDVAEQEIKTYIATYPDNPDLHFWLADLYLTNKAVDRAVQLLQGMVDRGQGASGLDKQGLNARTSLARLQFVKGDKALAEKLTQAVLEHEPNNGDALFIRAHMLFDRGAYQEAVSVLRTVVRDNPKAVDALQLLSETLLIQGYLDLAVDTLSQLVQVAPTNLAAKVRLAQLYAMQGDAPRAKALLELVTKIEPLYAVGWETVARVAIGAKDWAGAEAAVKTLEGLEGQARTALFLRGQMAAAKGAYQDALPFYQQTITPDPLAPIAEHALSALVEASSKLNKLQDAVQFITGLNRESPLVFGLLAQSYLQLGQKDEAAQFYDKAIAAKASSSAPYLSRAQLFVAEKKYGEAMEVLKKAREETRGDPRAALMLATLLEQKGQYKESIAIYEEMLARNPNEDAAANNAAQLIADTMADDAQALERARVMAERFIRSSSPYFLDTLGWVYFRQGKIEQAQTIFERVMAFDQKKLPAQAHYHYGALLAKTGKTVEAKEALKKALAGTDAYAGRAEAEALFRRP